MNKADEKLFEYIFEVVSLECGDGDAVVYLTKRDAEVIAKQFHDWLKTQEGRGQSHFLSSVGGFHHVSDRCNENFTFTNNPYLENQPQWFTVVVQTY